MKSEHLQQCIIIVLVFYFLFSIFYKCPCTKKTLESLVPNIDIDIPDIDIDIKGNNSDNKDDYNNNEDDNEDEDEDDKENDKRDTKISNSEEGGSWSDIFEDLKEIIVSNVQLLIVIGIFIGTIFIGIIFVRNWRETEEKISTINVPEVTETLKSKMTNIPISKDKIKKSLKGVLSKGVDVIKSKKT